MIIRPAQEHDLPAILDIYNDAVVNSTAIWNWNTVDLANRKAWFAQRTGQNYPVLVADIDGMACGYASYGDWRPIDGYCFTVEHSVYIAASRRGLGMGRALLGALIEAAQMAGKHVMLGGIDADNEASLKLHAAFGFTQTARMPQVGHKFGRWRDLVLMQKIL